MTIDELERSGSPRDLRLLIRVLTPFLIAALVAGALVLYRRATVQVEERFNERQAYLARQAADRLSEVFAEVRKMLVVVGDRPADEEAAARRGPLLAKIVEQLHDHGAVAAWRQGRSGRVLEAAGADRSDLEPLAARLPGCTARQQLCLEGPLIAPLTASHRVLAARLPGGSTVVLLDWGLLKELVARLTKLSAQSYAWVLDGEGRLIMHPEHQDQLGRDALRLSRGRRGDPPSLGPAGCAGCHLSFELHRRMARGGSGTGRIQVQGGEPKLVAYTPVTAGAKAWSLAVATPASQVTAQERRHLLGTLLFTGAMLLVMVTGAVLLDRESSRRVKATAAFSRELAAKVAERTEEIHSLYDQLAALRAHHTRLERVAVAGEMAAIVAHEIRTPLNALSISAQMVSRKLRRGGELERDKVLEALGNVENEIQRINALLEDHLLARVPHRPWSARPIRLNELVEEVLRFMAPEAARARVEFASSLAGDLPPVAADAGKVRQVLLNIVLNAIQAMPGGGEVLISTARDEELGTVTVRDTGPGIASLRPESPGDDIEQVFRPFVTTKEDGTGLGLAICARLAKEMGGRIRVFSRPGEGASFVVALPLWSAARAASPVPATGTEEVRYAAGTGRRG